MAWLGATALVLTGCSGGGSTKPTTTPSTQPSVAPTKSSSPPAVDLIAFASGSFDGPRHLFTIDTSSSQVAHLTSGDGIDYEPQWSPDGSKILFARYAATGLNSKNDDIWVMNADGTGAIDLTNDPSADREASWSPDGSKIAFTSDRSGNDEIYVMAADGSGVVDLTNSSTDENSPSWSPDGKRIAFSGDRNGNSSNNDYDIWVMGSDGSNPVDLTNSDADDLSPSWSPDGARIAFSSYIGTGHINIFVVNANGAGLKQLTDGDSDEVSPTWTPDGSKIVFELDRGDTREGDGFVMNPDGTERTALTGGPASFNESSVNPRFDSASLTKAEATPLPIPSQAPPPSSSPSGEPFPNAAEQALLAHIPAAIADTCQRNLIGPTGPTASLACHPTGTVVSTYYYLYSTVAEMNQQYQFDIPTGISGGDCAKDVYAEHPWYFKGQSKPAGRVLCYRSDSNKSAIEWTYDSLRILSAATRPDPKNGDLYRFWFNDAGPEA